MFHALLLELSVISLIIWQVVDDRELLYLHERGKKKLMEGSRVVFPGQKSPVISVVYLRCHEGMFPLIGV